MNPWLKKYLLLLVFLGGDTVVILLHFLLKEYYGFFNLDGEQNLNSTYSGLKLMLIGFFALGQIMIFWRLRTDFLKIALWTLVASSFFYLGLDELAALHERAGFVLNNFTGLTEFKGASFNWIIYFSPLIILALLTYLKLIFSLWKENKKTAVFLIVGVFLWFMALGSEFASGLIFYPQGLLTDNFNPYFAFLVLEEIFELIGATFLLIGIADYVFRQFNQHFTLKSLCQK